MELVVDLPANRLERESEVVQKLGHTQNIPKPIFLGVTSQNIPTQKLVFTSQNQLILEIQIFPIYEQSGSFKDPLNNCPISGQNRPPKHCENGCLCLMKWELVGVIDLAVGHNS